MIPSPIIALFGILFSLASGISDFNDEMNRVIDLAVPYRNNKNLIIITINFFLTLKT